MAWQIAEVARISGVTARTLRHYDEIGLLPPAGTGVNGHRYYEESQLLRLQQILVLRELGLGLREIAGILGEQGDELESLRAHHLRLVQERKRLDTLARTVARTIVELQKSKEDDMVPRINRPENLFEGFDPSQYETELREEWPQLAEQAARLAASMTEAEIERGQRERTAQLIRMAEFMIAGTPVDDPAVQAEIDSQYQVLAQVPTMGADEFRAVGRACVDNEQWRAAYEEIAVGLAEYQRDAVLAYVDTHLG
ncbi:MerR family transcriptional regulator [Kitasatospora sp. GP82]|uniref:MerR family transcriptional regulator n=1 Tax=Kitasatospora sp. GP82 TaxID=3035089 RepID=UPI002476210D|nr:MerR family transcriptional regulator [Kitasatospora sp. GP82]MDH6125658.1 DNA-binding transcriptional MerR regulator [Kitasatospora sp. GP82]